MPLCPSVPANANDGPPFTRLGLRCVDAFAFRQTRATTRSDTEDQRKGTAAAACGGAGAWVCGGLAAALGSWSGGGAGCGGSARVRGRQCAGAGAALRLQLRGGGGLDASRVMFGLAPHGAGRGNGVKGFGYCYYLDNLIKWVVRLYLVTSTTYPIDMWVCWVEAIPLGDIAISGDVLNLSVCTWISAIGRLSLQG
jgi:hypothetical protein